MEIALRVVQFWSEIKLVITNRTPASRSCDFVITRLISDQIALHSVQLPLLITTFFFKKLNYKSYIVLTDGLKTYILCPTRSFMNLPILNLVISFVRRSDKFSSDVTYVNGFGQDF